MERRATIKRSRLLVLISLLLLAAAAVLFAVNFALATHTKVLTIGDIEGMRTVRGTYRSINRWNTVEETTFRGATVSGLLEESGVLDGKATVKLIAPDGYFWPPVNKTITTSELKRKNGSGLVPIVAFEIGGKPLDPEPDGTGPLRYVAPQYSADDMNKPSWVSNLRVIEVGPLKKGTKKLDAKKVPPDEVRIYGNISPVNPYSMTIPLATAAAGLAVLLVALVIAYGKKSRTGAELLVALVLVLLLAAGVSLGPGRPRNCRAAQSVTFSKADLESMPATSGHYTFLKQQPPYTYFEADYTGVPLSYLINERLNLSPGASGVVVRSTDGYTASLSLDQVNRTYPGGLKVIIAYTKGGSSLVGDEGPLRLIVPQASPGNHDQGGDANTPLCARMVYAVEVSPSGAPPAPGSVPSGSLAVYGSVETPPPAQDTPSRQPQPQPQAPANTAAQTGPTVAAQPRQQGDVLLAAINRTFGDPRHMVSWLVGSTIAGAFPGPTGRALLLLYFVCGI